MPSFLKTLNLRLGVFFVCYFSLSSSWAQAQPLDKNCPVNLTQLQEVTLARVIDGDTVVLSSGQKVRLIGINTPELFSRQPGQKAIAALAKRAAQSFFLNQNKIYLQFGVEAFDRHGRRLAHIYRQDGLSLTAFLLARGLGWQVLVPPNALHADCYGAIELQARVEQRGVWSPSLVPVNADNLQAGHAGFQLVFGKIKKVTRSKNGWWLEMGRLAILISNDDIKNFNGEKIEGLVNKMVLIKGWVIDRSASKLLKSKAYPPFMVRWRHPLMEIGLLGEAKQG